eukprot:COSAG01_NODE_10322_length_2193_cov_2.908309_4_plen_70_part_00
MTVSMQFDECESDAQQPASAARIAAAGQSSSSSRPAGLRASQSQRPAKRGAKLTPPAFRYSAATSLAAS